jgi:hypothetical protein
MTPSILPQDPPPSRQRDAGAEREPDALPTEAADDIEMPLPSNPQTFFLGGLLILAVLAAVYVASSIILPVVLAFVLQLILQPAVRLLQRVQVPRAVGALLEILLSWARLWALYQLCPYLQRCGLRNCPRAYRASKLIWSS